MPKDSGRNRTHQGRYAANQRQAGKENSPQPPWPNVAGTPYPEKPINVIVSKQTPGSNVSVIGGKATNLLIVPLVLAHRAEREAHTPRTNKFRQLRGVSLP